MSGAREELWAGASTPGRLCDAMNQWNDKQSYLSLGNGIAQAGDVFVGQGSFSWGAYASTSWVCSGQTMSNEQIYMNSRTMSGFNATRVRKVATHEIGHTRGLDHTQRNCDASVMVSNACVTSSYDNYPYWDDINGVRDWGY